jgi:hypothetical protein
VVDDWLSLPVIGLESGRQIEVSFDEIGEQSARYVYNLIHCNADWTKSQLIQSEYMSGFQNLLIEDYENSFNTTMLYVNYKIYFPNPDLTLKVSGNYAVQVFKEDDTQKPILTACFSVLEEESRVNMKVSSNTDIDFNKAHQQVEFNITYDSRAITSPVQEFKVYVTQNNRRDNMASLVQPTNVQNGRLIYSHNKNLIFEAGNEYRRFEMISSRYNGLNISKIGFHSPYFHVDLFPDEIRANRSYLYDEDIDGKYFIRTTEGVDYDYESDYFFVHFTLPCEKPFPENIYMLSEIFNNILDERSKVKYNELNKAYEMTLLLKEGAYNYKYVSKKSDTTKGSTALIEGNYFPTENEYAVWVYHRPFGGKYDHLISVQTLKFTP